MGQLAEKHMGLCWSIAKSYCNRSLADLDDLAQEGFFGLLRAEELYDSSKGEFHKYACYWIKSYIRRALQDNWSRVRLPNHCYGKWAKYVKAENGLKEELGREPLFSEVMEYLGDLSERQKATFWYIRHTVRKLNVMENQITKCG